MSADVLAPEPKRIRLLRALLASLGAIHVADGYATNAGDKVVLGSLIVGANEDLRTALPALALQVDRTNTPAQGRQVHIHLPLTIQALVLEDDKDPWMAAELMVADVKRALFGPGADLTLGGLAADFTQGEVQPAPREKGSSILGLQVEASVSYVEDRGAP